MLFLDLADDDGPAATQAVDRPAEDCPPRTGAKARPTDDDPTTYQLPDAPRGDQVRRRGRRHPAGDGPGGAWRRYPLHVVSAERGDGLDELRKAIFDLLGVMRIYTKQPGKPADMASPFTCPVGSTVAEFAGRVHNDFEEKVKSARVWGSGAFDGQTVGRDHVLKDKDCRVASVTQSWPR